MNSGSEKSNKITGKDRLIFALDYPSLDEASEAVSLLRDRVGIFKIGLELFSRSGPGLAKAIQEKNKGRVFLDLKLYDIPATVYAATRAVRDMGVRFLTVHSSGGFRMLETAVRAAGTETEILAVTVLTSFNRSDLEEIGFDSSIKLSELVYKRAELAQKSGCAGVICSGSEIREIKKRCGADFLTVVPGIRPEWGEVAGDDQQRVATPQRAILDGADYLVVGRPIRTAPNPLAAADRLGNDMTAAFSKV